MIDIKIPYDQLLDFDQQRRTATGPLNLIIRKTKRVQDKCVETHDELNLVYKLDLLIWYRVNYD